MDAILDSTSNSGGEEEKDVETESNCSSYEETCAKIETALRRGLKLGPLRSGANGHGGMETDESSVLIIGVLSGSQLLVWCLDVVFV